MGILTRYDVKVGCLDTEELVVRKDGETLVLSDLSDRRLRDTLLLWHSDRSNPPECLCTEQYAPLSVCMRARVLYLRAYPKTKWKHADQCRFFGLPDIFDPNQQYTRSAKSVDDQTGVISLSGVLPTQVRGERKVGHGDLTVGVAKRLGIRGKYSKVTAIGLLNELWRGAKLDSWSPGKDRLWVNVIEQLHKLSKRIKYNNTSLADRLCFVGGPGDYIASRWFDDVSNRYRNSAHRDQRFFLVTVLSGVGSALYSQELRIRGSSRRIYCDEGVIRMLERRYPVAFDAISGGAASEYCVALMSCYWSATGRFLKCDTGACLPVDKNFIPFDSPYEREVGIELVKQNRRFVKPLHVDSGENWLPSFVMLDTNPHTVITIVSNDAKDQAQVSEWDDGYCQTSKYSRWEWNPAQQVTMPAFPEPMG